MLHAPVPAAGVHVRAHTHTHTPVRIHTQTHACAHTYTRLCMSDGYEFEQDLEIVGSLDREAWRAAVHGVAKSWTRLSD